MISSGSAGMLMDYFLQDPYTSSSTVAGLYDKFGTGEKTLFMYPGLSHINSADEQLQSTVVGESLDWLATAVKRCRSPATPRSTVKVHFPDGTKGEHASKEQEEREEKEEKEELVSFTPSK